jgi:hypothetical protein
LPIALTGWTLFPWSLPDRLAAFPVGRLQVVALGVDAGARVAQRADRLADQEPIAHPFRVDVDGIAIDVAGGVAGTENEGSAWLMRAAAEKGGEAFGARGWSPEERERLRQHNARLDLANHLVLDYSGPLWAGWEIGLLGTVPDREVARQTGRSVAGVRKKQMKLGIANSHDERRTKKRWRGPRSERGDG